ncbi:hypothetical protein KW803_00545 [Candidatus Saccharibacteria bacterium]|nr:hypothetical protein [Candidatus Saccharibacteria bacterium]
MAYENTPNSENFRKNFESLMRTGAVPSSRAAAYPNIYAESTAEDLLKKSIIPPAEIAIRGLNRLYAVTLFRELDTNLNVQSDADKDRAAHLAAMSESSLYAIDREPIYVRTEIGSEFDILLQESEPGTGRFDLEIRQGLADAEDYTSFRSYLHTAYNGIISSIDLSKSSLEPEPVEISSELIEAVKPPANGIEKRLSVWSRTKRKKEKGFLKPEERRKFSDDLEEITFVLDILGIDDLENNDQKSLVNFWREINRDYISAIDVFMYMSRRAQELKRVNTLAIPYPASEYFVYAKEWDKDDLRMTLERDSISFMTENLQVLTSKAVEYFDPTVSETDRVRLRYLTWLASDPSMTAVKNKAREVLRQNLNPYADEFSTKIGKIYEIANDQLLLLRSDLLKGTGADTWAPDQLVFDKTIPSELYEYNRLIDFYNTAIYLGKYLFTNEDMDTYIRG